MTIRLFRNKKGVTPTISTVMMVAVTVLVMLIVISFGLNFIEARNAQMGEELVVEKVFFLDSSQLKVYLRNVGHRDLTLVQVKINGTIYDLSPEITLQENEGDFVIIDGVFQNGIYQISFYSSRYNELGNIEVEYS